MNGLFALIKMTVQLLVVSSFILCSFLVDIFVRDPIRRRHTYCRLTNFYGGVCLRVMGIQLTVKGQHHLQGKNYLLVCNHTGFIDIFAVASQFPSLFITSTDMKATPGLGLLTEFAGCLYVDRKNRSNIHKEILVIREALQQGLNVVLFPEAAAHSGEKIYPFKKTLMTAAAGTGVEILPAVINFRKINGQPMGPQWRDNVFWYGPAPFVGAAWRAFQIRSAEMELEFLTPIICATEEARREVAARAQHMIESKYTPIPILSEIKV